MADPIKVIKGLLGAEEDLGEFIRGGPSTGLPGHVRDKFRHRCNEFANLPPWAKALSGVAGGSIGRICQPYWDDNGWDGPTRPPAGIPGGQCEGVPYTVGSLGTEACPTSAGDVSIIRSGLGPLTVSVLSTVDTGQFPRPLLTTFAIAFADGTQTMPVRHDAGFIACVRAFRTDGLPDECGDPPNDPVPGPNPPPNPGPLPGPEPTDNPDPDNPIPFLPIPPFEDPVFGPQPITGPSDSPPPAAPAPPAGGDGLPGDPDAIGGEAGEVSGGDDGENVDFGAPPEGRIWVGCIVETTTDSRVGNIPGTGPQSTVWPSVRANVALRYGSFLGKSERINSRFYDVFRPNTSLTVTGCFLQVQSGSTSKVFPVSALKCPENPCEEANG